MSALGHKKTLGLDRSMSALSPKADIAARGRHVRFVPKADIRLSAEKVRRTSKPIGPPTVADK
jgi:hypothetical protein